MLTARQTYTGWKDKVLNMRKQHGFPREKTKEDVSAIEPNSQKSTPWGSEAVIPGDHKICLVLSFLVLLLVLIVGC